MVEGFKTFPISILKSAKIILETLPPQLKNCLISKNYCQDLRRIAIFIWVFSRNLELPKKLLMCNQFLGTSSTEQLQIWLGCGWEEYAEIKRVSGGYHLFVSYLEKHLGLVSFSAPNQIVDKMNSIFFYSRELLINFPVAYATEGLMSRKGSGGW